MLDVPAGGSSVVRLRLAAVAPAQPFGDAFDATVAARLADADEFYERIAPPTLTKDERRVHRQALAGMLWSKQYYLFDVDTWLKEHDAHPLLGPARSGVRNSDWFHMFNGDVISMPDKWEYPWYAAWDLAFHTISLALVDFDFAKEQLLLMLRSLYGHPNGQIPAYEWNFSDVNPPVHAWATLFLFHVERGLGREDVEFLERSFHGLALNFNWWLNRKDPEGRNVFAGGFLGLDNIGVFDRSSPLPTGGRLEQADGTAWMALYCQNMIEIALILAEHDPQYEEYAFTFLQHFIWIAYAMDRIGDHHDEMWDEEDGFYYDVLRLPDGSAKRLKVRSMVGLLPLCASTVFEPDVTERHPRLVELIDLFRERYPEVLAQVAPTEHGYIGRDGRRLLSPLSRDRLVRVLGYLLDEDEFLGPYGIRSLSKVHLDHPFQFDVEGTEFTVGYLPAESDSGMFGGNSNWRGPVWMPVNALIVRGLLNLHSFYGDELRVECPTGSGNRMTLFEVAAEISRRLESIFLRDERRQPAGPRRQRDVPGGRALARPHPVLRVLPRRQRGGDRRQPPDRLDGPGRATDRPLRPRGRGDGCQDVARRAARPDHPRGGGRDRPAHAVAQEAVDWPTRHPQQGSAAGSSRPRPQGFDQVAEPSRIRDPTVRTEIERHAFVGNRVAADQARNRRSFPTRGGEEASAAGRRSMSTTLTTTAASGPASRMAAASDTVGVSGPRLRTSYPASVRMSASIATPSP